MPRYKIFDPVTVSLSELNEKIEASADLITRCELAMYLRRHDKGARQVTILSYCLSQALESLQNIHIARDQSGPSNTEEYERKLNSISDKLEMLEANPKETKTYAALLESLKRQYVEYSRLVTYGDIPKPAHKYLARLQLMLTRINECLKKLDAEGVTYPHLVAIFPRLDELMEDDLA